MGTRLLNATQDYTKQARSGVYTGSAVQPGASPAQTTQHFARGGLGAEDPRDELMQEKMEFLKAGGQTGNTKFGQITATDEDFEWLQRKRDTEALANMDAWISDQFHTGDVATRKWLQEVYPDYYEARERELMDRAKFALRVKLLLLRGPKNHKDLILLWGLQTGQIELDRDWDRIGPSQSAPDQATEQRHFKKGLFNPLRYRTDGERLSAQGGPVGAPNPFKPVNDSAAGGQGAGIAGTGRPFKGGPVADPNRYPTFLQGIL